MRVLVIVPDRYAQGGASRFLGGLLGLQRRHGFETALLVPSHHLESSYVSLAGEHGVELIAAANGNRPGTRPLCTPVLDLLFSWRALRDWRPDLVVVSTSEPGRMSVALYFPVPVLYILHTLPEGRFRPLPRLYLRLGAAFNNLVMTVSRAAAASVCANMGVPAEKIAVVHNSSPPVRRGAPAATPSVVTAGHLVPYKNPELWLQVAQQVLRRRAEVTFTWLGDGELLLAMRERVRELGLGERVLFPGQVPDTSPWLEKSQVYFQPSLQESHGIAVLEAMRRALPCVVSDAGGLPESVADGETGFVCGSLDEAAFAGRILRLLDDASLRGRMGEAGLHRAERCFSEQEQELKIMALYQTLAGKRAAR